MRRRHFWPLLESAIGCDDLATVPGHHLASTQTNVKQGSFWAMGSFGPMYRTNHGHPCGGHGTHERYKNPLDLAQLFSVLQSLTTFVPAQIDLWSSFFVSLHYRKSLPACSAQTSYSIHYFSPLSQHRRLSVSRPQFSMLFQLAILPLVSLAGSVLAGTHPGDGSAIMAREAFLYILSPMLTRRSIFSPVQLRAPVHLQPPTLAEPHLTWPERIPLLAPTPRLLIPARPTPLRCSPLLRVV